MNEELIKLSNPLPIKAYPKAVLEEVFENQFKYFISKLLSMKPENEEKITDSFPAVEKHCWSLGFNEVKKMFEMYADGELSIKPISNHFDRVLVGQIANEYKQIRKPLKTPVNTPEMSQEEKDKIVFLGAVNCFDSFVQDGYIINGYVWVYDHLDDLKLLNYTPQEKRDMMPIARERLIEDEKTSRTSYQQFMKDLENGRKQQAIINKAKVMLLERYFAKLKARNEHIKDYL